MRMAARAIRAVRTPAGLSAIMQVALRIAARAGGIVRVVVLRGRGDRGFPAGRSAAPSGVPGLAVATGSGVAGRGGVPSADAGSVSARARVSAPVAPKERVRAAYRVPLRRGPRIR